MLFDRATHAVCTDNSEMRRRAAHHKWLQRKQRSAQTRSQAKREAGKTLARKITARHTRIALMDGADASI